MKIEKEAAWVSVRAEEIARVRSWGRATVSAQLPGCDEPKGNFTVGIVIR